MFSSGAGRWSGILLLGAILVGAPEVRAGWQGRLQAEGERIFDFEFDLMLPQMKQGKGTLFGWRAGYQLLPHLAFRAGWGLLVDDHGETVPGNPNLGVASGICGGEGGVFGCIRGELDLGLGLAPAGGEAGLARARLGVLTQLDRLQFEQESLVLEPGVVGSLGLGGFLLEARLAPALAFPVRDIEARSTAAALSWGVHFSSGFGIGTWALLFSFGVVGIAEFDSGERHSAVDAGGILFADPLGLVVRGGVRVLLERRLERLDRSVFLSLGWAHSFLERTSPEGDSAGRSD